MKILIAMGIVSGLQLAAPFLTQAMVDNGIGKRDVNIVTLILMENLQHFYKGRTVVIAAHRLSTIRNADNIIVINEGRIAEQGTHESLINRKGEYYNLICNQI